MGKYWGYQVRVAHSIKEVFQECPYEGGYDLKIGDASNGDKKADIIDFVDFSKYQNFKHCLIFFGGLEGVPGVIDNMESDGNYKG